MMILVTGATGFLGKRVCKLLREKGLEFTTTSLSTGLDLRHRADTLKFMAEVRPTHILNCAAFVGGIQFGYKHSAELFHDNLHMSLNLLESARMAKVKRLVNPISNCAYPGEARVFREDEFWDGPLHESVLVYGLVRKISWVGARAYASQYGLDVINLIFSNMYGPEDHFEEERSHALGALIMKIVRAKRERQPSVIIWGTGRPVREWLHVDDGAEAMVRAMDVSSCVDPINIGVQQGISILALAEMIRDLVGYDGELIVDPSKPDGAPFKTVDGSRGKKHFRWEPSRKFSTGVADTIKWYMKHGERNV